MQKADRKPICYIVGGPNGAGKTTFSLCYLPAISGCRNFINADLIAQGLSPLNPESVQLEAGRLFLREIENYIKRRQNFAFETTLSGRGHLNLIHRLRSSGWRVELFYLWIPDAGFSSRRVKERVKHGGHNISDEALLRRFPRSINNLLKEYSKICDLTVCYDNSAIVPSLIFEESENGIKIFDRERFELLERSIR
ncbi:MAG: hypothetical protein A2017_22320 [Lentisphaerae bacterium GWF2_44_16]|nr:MAG: hypothetical protein A2017_22320 [Lentisphaerae bacterium GWF2_44_16]